MRCGRMRYERGAGSSDCSAVAGGLGGVGGAALAGVAARRGNSDVVFDGRRGGLAAGAGVERRGSAGVAYGRLGGSVWDYAGGGSAGGADAVGERGAGDGGGVYACGDLEAERFRFGFVPLTLIMMMGVNGAFLAGDIFNLYVWFEVLLSASFVLLALGGERRQMEGSVKYVTLNLISSALFLAGVGLLYGMAGR